MRILYIPFFSNSANHNGCSIYNTTKVIFRHWVDIDSDVYVYFLLPKDFPYKEEEIINHPRIEKVYVDALPEQHDEKVFLPREIFELFNVKTGKYYYDVVVCDKVQLTSWIRMILEDKKRKSEGRTPYINFAEFIAKKEGRFRNTLDEYEYTLSLGWLSGWNVYQNKRHAKKCFEIAGKYLKPYWLKRIMERSFIVNLFGVDTERLDKYARENSYQLGDELVINYAHRMATHYNPMFILNVVDKIFSSGEKVKLLITTPSAGTGTAVMQKLKKMEERGLPVEIYHALPQEEFYQKASRAHLFISAIDETETANSIFEQMYLGQVGIMPERNWVKDFIPEYPYIYNDFNSAYMLVKEFIKKPHEFKKVVDKYKLFIKNNWSIRKNSEKVLDWIKKISEISTYQPPNNVITITKEIMEKAGHPEIIDYNYLKRIFKEKSWSGVNIEKETYKGYTKFDWIKALKKIGYKDTLEKDLAFKRI